MKALLATAILLAPMTLSASEPNRQVGFLCVPDHATGYAQKGTGNWEPVQFDIKNRRHLFRIKDERWYWTEFGGEPDEPFDLCTPPNEHGFSECKNREDAVLFNRNTLRYQIVRAYGYVVADLDVEKESPMTPLYEIGRCSPL
jgi:hypothetical protein